MSKVKAELKGMDELMKRIEEMGRKGAIVENKALKEAGQVLAKAMKSEAPRRTGRLAESIEVSGVRTKKGNKRVEVGPTVFYARFNEMGTSKMGANPFMARSFNSNKAKLQALMKAEIRKGLGL